MVAEVTVDVSGNKTGNSSSDKAMIKELKDLTSLLKKGFSTGASGLFKGAGIFGAGELASGGLGGIGGALTGGALAGLLGLSATIPGSEALPGTIASGTSFEKMIGGGGESLVAETDRTTGNILNILTEREAKERGILTATGRLQSKYDDQESKFDDLTKDLEKRKDAVVLSTDKAIELGILQDKELEIQKAINRTMNSRLASLGASPVRTDVDVVGVVGDGGINIVAASAYNDAQERATQGLLSTDTFNPAAFNFFNR